MNKEQMKKDIEELKGKGHITQQEMKMLVNMIVDLFEYVVELEEEIEKDKKSFLTFEDDDLRELISRLSDMEDYEMKQISDEPKTSSESTKDVEIKDEEDKGDT